MAIDLDVIHGRLSRAIGGGGSVFDANFLSAVNDVVADLNSATGLEIEEVDNDLSPIDIDALKYSRVFRDGILYYLALSGEWAKEDIGTAKAKYDRAMALAQFEYVNDQNPESGYLESDDSEG